MNRSKVLVVLMALLSLTIVVNGFAESPSDSGTGAATAASDSGAWVDEVVFLEEANQAAGISRLQAGEFDIFAYPVADAELFRRVLEDPNLSSATSYGNYNEITFNPAGPVFPATGKLNPFGVARIREAFNYLVDREFIAEEIYSGLAVPRFTTVSSAVPDYSRLIDTTRAIELEYAYDMQKAEEIISEEMVKLGATLSGGKWQYDGEPVELIAIIRIEDARREIGDYVSNQLEEIGFTVDRQYKSSAEASPIWLRGNPDDGLFHFYTGGWVSTQISRDEGGNFDFFYTQRGLAVPLWTGYNPSPEFDAVSKTLADADFASLDERADLFREALTLSMQDSVRVFLTTQTGAAPFKNEVEVAADLSGSIYGAWLWPHTLNMGGAGGEVTIGLPSMLPNPWNPVNGSNWIYDQMMIRGSGEQEVYPDPFTGLNVPNRIQRASVDVLRGTPIGSSTDWMTLNFVNEINVPADAWVDWNASAEEFVTVGEAFPDGLTAKTKITTVYEDDYLTRTWHDGSTISVADHVMFMISVLDFGDSESAMYDEQEVSLLENFKSTFRGFRVVDTDPVTTEYYTDVSDLDAENLVDGASFFPQYRQGQGAWHTIGVAVRAEVEERLAFGSGKADLLEVEWTNFIAGPSLDILGEELEEALAESYIPYAALEDFISPSEARARYQNLLDWYNDKGHFWVGTGPMYLEEAFPIEKSLVLRRYEDYRDSRDKWAGYGEPPIATVELSGPSRVTGGSAAEFTAQVTRPDGSVYAAGDIDSVKYLLFDASGALIKVGDATGGSGGTWNVALSAADTRQLGAGSSRLEIAVAPKPVVIPSFDALDFTSTR